MRVLTFLLAFSCTSLLLHCLTGESSEVTIIGCGDHPCDRDAGDGGDADG